MEAFTDMTKLVEAFGLEEVLVVVQVIGSDTETQSHRRTIYRRFSLRMSVDLEK